MTAIKTSISTISAAFKANAEAMAALVLDVKSRMATAALGGDERSHKRHTERGKLLPRSRSAASSAASRRCASAAAKRRRWSGCSMLLRILLLGFATTFTMAVPASATEQFRDCAGCPDLVIVPAGMFSMGSPPDDPDHQDAEGPQHRVTVARRFAIGKFDVTREQYALFAAGTGGAALDPKCDWTDPKSRGEPFRQGPREPVVCVSWNDANAYAAWLSARTGHVYRLPSEAEWEYAARAGAATARPWGDAINRDDANYGSDKCCGPAVGGRDRWRFTSPVGSFAGNRFGLYDMLGNVWQWTQDCAADYAAAEKPDCSRHMVRGGAWFQAPDQIRSAARAADSADFRIGDIGFRVARDLDEDLPPRPRRD